MNLIEFLNYKNYCESAGMSPCNSKSLERYFNFKRGEIKL